MASDKDYVIESLQGNDVSTMSKSELMAENRILKRKVEHSVKFALALGVIALVCLGVVVGMLINTSLDDEVKCVTNSTASA